MAKELAKNTNKDMMAQVKRTVDSLIQQGGTGFRFSNRTAIDTVARAIEIQCDASKSDDEKKIAALFSAGVAVNSLTAGEEVQRMIEEAILREGIR